LYSVEKFLPDIGRVFAEMFCNASDNTLIAENALDFM